MTSYLLITEIKEKGQEEALRICNQKGIQSFDVTIFEMSAVESKGAPKKSWGIDDVKLMLQKISLKPYKGSWKAVIIYDAHLLTREAQNALLKVLEEPPRGTLLILVADREESFLPTVISRCSIVRISEKFELTEEEKRSILREVEALGKSSTGERLKKAEIIGKNKTEASMWIKKALIAQHDVLGSDTAAVGRLRTLSEIYTIINTSNVNIRLVLENFFLKIR